MLSWLADVEVAAEEVAPLQRLEREIDTDLAQELLDHQALVLVALLGQEGVLDPERLPVALEHAARPRR